MEQYFFGEGSALPPILFRSNRSNLWALNAQSMSALRSTQPNKTIAMPRKTALIIGAGPAGLTAAYELVHRTDIQPIVLEKSEYIGGISRTVRYKGNRIDIGGHRFFSKSDRVMNWWMQVMPVEGDGGAPYHLLPAAEPRDYRPGSGWMPVTPTG